MPMRKVAVSLPEPVLRAVDQLAEQRGESRSHVVATILSRVTAAKSDREVTAAIDALFADGEVQSEQTQVAESFRSIGEWKDEAW